MTPAEERKTLQELMGRIGACLDMPKLLIEALQTSARCADRDSPEYATVFALARLGKYVMSLPASAWDSRLRPDPEPTPSPSPCGYNGCTSPGSHVIYDGRGRWCEDHVLAAIAGAIRILEIQANDFRRRQAKKEDRHR